MRTKTTLAAVAKLLGAEGFSEHCANEIKRYWLSHHVRPGAAARVARTRKAFTDVAKAKLDERDRIVVGKFISLLCRASFDTGLRAGLLTTVGELEAKGAGK